MAKYHDIVDAMPMNGQGELHKISLHEGALQNFIVYCVLCIYCILFIMRLESADFQRTV